MYYISWFTVYQMVHFWHEPGAPPRNNAEAQVACLRGVARLVYGMAPPDVTEQAGRLPHLPGLTQETITRELTEAAAPRTPLAGTVVGRLRVSRQVGTHHRYR